MHALLRDNIVITMNIPHVFIYNVWEVHALQWSVVLDISSFGNSMDVYTLVKNATIHLQSNIPDSGCSNLEKILKLNQLQWLHTFVEVTC